MVLHQLWIILKDECLEEKANYYYEVEEKTKVGNRRKGMSFTCHMGHHVAGRVCWHPSIRKQCIPCSFVLGILTILLASPLSCIYPGVLYRYWNHHFIFYAL